MREREHGYYNVQAAVGVRHGIVRWSITGQALQLAVLRRHRRVRDVVRILQPDAGADRWYAENMQKYQRSPTEAVFLTENMIKN